MEEESDSTNLLKPIFLFLNTFTYFTFICIAIYNDVAVHYINQGFLKAMCGLVGVIYLILMACMMNYGGKLAYILYNLI